MTGNSVDSGPPWYRLLNRYQWFVLVVAALGWLFDCMDQQLFVLARPSAMRELLETHVTDEMKAEHDYATWIKVYSGYVTAIFLVGWAVGGLVFGVLGDRIGRARTMLITILIYSCFTGLSALSRGFWDFAIYRFLTGMGVGGEFAVGVALVAETMPERARPACLALLQMLTCVGNVIAATIATTFGVLQAEGWMTSPWRKMFWIGAIPALLVVVIRARLKEPERWSRVAHDDAIARQLGSYGQLFGQPKWRKHALIGLTLAFSGVVGLWGVGFFAPDLTRSVMRPKIIERVLTAATAEAQAAGNTERVAELAEIAPLFHTPSARPTESQAALHQEISQKIGGREAVWGGTTAILFQVGAFFGMFAFGWIAQRWGRRPSFAIALIAACLVSALVFLQLKSFDQLVWMMPLLGFCQLSVFAGYAMYLPELFPTHLRSTGTSFCYNVGRAVAAVGVLTMGELNKVFSSAAEPMRYAGLCMCSVFLVGLVILPWAPETRDKPLPD
jgi:MFS family permease